MANHRSFSDFFLVADPATEVAPAGGSARVVEVILIIVVVVEEIKEFIHRGREREPEGPSLNAGKSHLPRAHLIQQRRALLI